MRKANFIPGSNQPPRLKIETLLIICQDGGAACGRLQLLSGDEIVFSTPAGRFIADRFRAGFRWNGGFINIQELEKIAEENGGGGRIIRARIRSIAAGEKSALLTLLSGNPSEPENLPPDFS